VSGATSEKTPSRHFVNTDLGGFLLPQISTQRDNKRHNPNPCGDQKMLTDVTVMKKLKA
jgi:hypothetical protein